MAAFSLDAMHLPSIRGHSHHGQPYVKLLCMPCCRQFHSADEWRCFMHNITAMVFL